jgi:hypothetical protein
MVFEKKLTGIGEKKRKKIFSKKIFITLAR